MQAVPSPSSTPLLAATEVTSSKPEETKTDYLQTGLDYFELQQYEKALPYLLTAAKSSQLGAYTLLEMIYDSTIPSGVTKNPEKAKLCSLLSDFKQLMATPVEDTKALFFRSLHFPHYDELVAKQGYPSAQVRLGQRYNKRKAFKEALENYKAAARQQFAPAYYQLAINYRDGLGISKDIYAAVDFFTLAAKLGHLSAYNALGQIYAYGYSDKFTKILPDIKSALFHYCSAAENGSALAQYNLGCLYGILNNLPDTEKSLAQAMYWFMHGAVQGHDLCQFYLGWCYSLDSPLHNIQKSLYWYQQAASQGLGIAHYLLGIYYCKGNEVTKDLAKGISLLKFAATDSLNTAAIKQDATKYLQTLGKDNPELISLLESTPAASVSEEDAAIPDLLLLEDINVKDKKSMLAEKTFTPGWATCPITALMMKEPTATPEGHSFEAKDIIRWSSVKKSCPLTRKPLYAQNLAPNLALRRSFRLLHLLNAIKQQRLVITTLQEYLKSFAITPRLPITTLSQAINSTAAETKVCSVTPETTVSPSSLSDIQQPQTENAKETVIPGESPKI